MNEGNKLSLLFDDLLFQTQRGGLTHAQIEKGYRHEQFEQITNWGLRYGYTFNIYPIDHLIKGEKHFHFDNKEKDTYCKIDFEGNLLEMKGRNSVSPKIEKELKYFLLKDSVKKAINEMWDKNNPHLVVG